jgi:hypothetical protein
MLFPASENEGAMRREPSKINCNSKPALLPPHDANTVILVMPHASWKIQSSRRQS